MNTFYPKPTIGGNNNTWATYIDMIMRAGGQGALTCELYNDSGVLKLSKGKIGINNDVVEGVAVIDTISTISTAGMTANNWHKIEVSVSGTAVTIEINPISGATDESTIDSTTKAAYNYEKAAYHLTASKRLIGVVFLRTALALGRIVNCESGKLGFKGMQTVCHYDSSNNLTIKYVEKLVKEIGDWNMDSTQYVEVSYPWPLVQQAIRSINVIIRHDSGVNVYSLNAVLDSADPSLIAGGISYNTGSVVALYRRAGGVFDNASFDSTSFNRGWVIVEYES